MFLESPKASNGSGFVVLVLANDGPKGSAVNPSWWTKIITFVLNSKVFNEVCENIFYYKLLLYN